MKFASSSTRQKLTILMNKGIEIDFDATEKIERQRKDARWHSTPKREKRDENQ